MREYKFRAKIKNSKINRWVYGYLVDEYHISEKNELGYTPIRKETIGQYTGLKDKNGTEIYEGDIVKAKLYTSNEEKYFTGKVEYCGSGFIVNINNNDSEYRIYDLDGFGENYRNNLEDLEVIGNEFDNPELLDEGE